MTGHQDAVYIDLGGSQAHRRDGEEGELVQDIIATETTLDEKLGQSQLRLFSSSKPLSSEEHEQQQDRNRTGAFYLVFGQRPQRR